MDKLGCTLAFFTMCYNLSISIMALLCSCLYLVMVQKYSVESDNVCIFALLKVRIFSTQTLLNGLCACLKSESRTKIKQ